MTDFLFLPSKITEDCDCNPEIRRWLPLGRKAMKNLESMLKSKDITLLTKVCIVKAMVFPEVMYSFESWTIKKAERRRIDSFELCCRRLLRVPWTARRPNQSTLKETNPEYSLEGLMLNLKLQHIGDLMWRANSLEKTLMLGKIEGRKRRGWQRMRWFWFCLCMYMYMYIFSHTFYCCYKPLPLHWALTVLCSFPYFFLFSFVILIFDIFKPIFFNIYSFVCLSYCSFPLAVNF